MAQAEDYLQTDTRARSEATAGLSTPTAIAEGAMIAADSDRVLLSPRVSSPGKDAWRRFRKNWAAMCSLTVVILITLMAVFAPFMHTMDPIAQSTLFNAAPSGAHWFGTDSLGSDEYSRLLFGLRIPLVVGFVGTTITVIVGTLIGVSAGYFGGFFDNLMSRFTDLMFAFPGFLLVLLVVSLYGKTFDTMPVLGSNGRVFLYTAILAFVSWPGLMRFVRSLGLSLKEQQFVEAARTSGSTNWKIIRRHLLPNMYGLILVQASLITVGIIYTAVVLSLFGLGVPSPNPDVGSMLFNGSQELGVANHLVFFPAIFLALLLVAFTFIGDGVRDAVDPRMNA
jgi:oligopeptide transport system permease protein